MNKQAHSSLFRSLDPKGQGHLSIQTVRAELAGSGLRPSDPRLEALLSQLAEAANGGRIEPGTFDALGGPGRLLFERTLRKELVIPDFAGFTGRIQEISESIQPLDDGAVADTIPQLARANPESFALSLCTIDGQRFDQGQHQQAFTFQSSIKPMLYCAALEEHGTAVVHRHIGREPSGLSFNELTLNPAGLPHNPMINAGAIMSASLLDNKSAMADRFDGLNTLVQRLSGHGAPGFDNATFHSERATADRNFALAHHMRERGAFPAGTDLASTLDLYFSACSLQTTTEAMASIAATFANGGVNPLTEERVFDEETVKHCLSMMYSCGMYDYSGEFAFRVGIPAKSAISGVILAVIPNVMGIAVWSPRLDDHGNSVRGVAFLKHLVETFNFHNYDNLVRSSKLDPRRARQEPELNATYGAIFAASTGDINELRRLVARGHDLDAGDYDGRTPLHLAAAEGQAETVRYLLDQGVSPQPRDRWKHTPADDAKRHRQGAVKLMLDKAVAQATDTGRKSARKAA